MPSDLIQKRFNELFLLSRKLNELGRAFPESEPRGEPLWRGNDPIHSLLGSFQTRLNALTLKVDARLEEEIVLDDGTQARLGYGRAPQWCLVYQTLGRSGEWSRPQPLLSASMDLRVKTLPYLAKILGVVKSETEKILSRLETDRP